MNDRAYPSHLITPDVYGDRRAVYGRVVGLLHITFQDRGLDLIDARSRALCKWEIHELMVTDEMEAGPGGGADHVSPIAFIEIERGGLSVIGDSVYVGGIEIGHIVGYDLTHMPNHMNILVKADSVEAPTISVGDEVLITKTS